MKLFLITIWEGWRFGKFGFGKFVVVCRNYAGSFYISMELVFSIFWSKRTSLFSCHITNSPNRQTRQNCCCRKCLRRSFHLEPFICDVTGGKESVEVVDEEDQVEGDQRAEDDLLPDRGDSHRQRTWEQWHQTRNSMRQKVSQHCCNEGSHIRRDDAGWKVKGSNPKLAKIFLSKYLLNGTYSAFRCPSLTWLRCKMWTIYHLCTGERCICSRII